jgi:hypothetical protein
VGWSRPLFYKKIGRQAESLSAHKWREKTERSVVDAGRRTVGSTQVCRLGVVVSPRSKGVIPLALKKVKFWKRNILNGLSCKCSTYYICMFCAYICTLCYVHTTKMTAICRGFLNNSSELRHQKISETINTCTGPKLKILSFPFLKV